MIIDLGNEGMITAVQYQFGLFQVGNLGEIQQIGFSQKQMSIHGAKSEWFNGRNLRTLIKRPGEILVEWTIL